METFNELDVMDTDRPADPKGTKRAAVEAELTECDSASSKKASALATARFSRADSQHQHRVREPGKQHRHDQRI